MTLDDIESVAVTEGPGLIGALLVGLSAAKAIAFARRLPLVPVDHLHGHLAALYLEPDPVEPPFLALLASGGHTLHRRGDDRRGVPRDRQHARRRGRRGVRQGRPPARPRLSGRGEARAAGGRRATRRRTRSRRRWSGQPGPRPLVQRREDRARATPSRREPDADHADLAASYQAAIVRSLVERAAEAVAVETDAGTLAVVGGVARNGGAARGVRRDAAASSACAWPWRRRSSAPTTRR